MSERKKERSPRRGIGKRRNSSKPLAGTATKKRAQCPGPEMPVMLGPTLVGYFVFRSQGYEALTPEMVSVGLFTDAMPAVHAIFEALFADFNMS